jgi:phosphoribosyl 1,2-cyclic phosphodiesterase
MVLDAGTGIRVLGRHLRRGRLRHLHVLLTHYHWDQVQGLPFFEPLYARGTTVDIYGPPPQSGDLSSLSGVLDALFRPPFFPVAMSDLKANVKLRQLDGQDDFRIGKVRVRTCRANHPQGALMYRIDSPGGSVMYATDHEPGKADFDASFMQLAHGVDVLICDAQYRPGELRAGKAGWGHGSWRAATLLGRVAGVRALILFHHEPWRSDHELDHFLYLARRTFPKTYVASEGMSLVVDKDRVAIGSRGPRLGVRAGLDLPVTVEQGGKSDARLTELSFYGAYLVGRRAYEPEKPIDVLLPMAARRNPLRLRGYVLRNDIHSGNGGIGVAVQFPARLEETAQPTD